jgi:hypothetical protein
MDVRAHISLLKDIAHAADYRSGRSGSFRGHRSERRGTTEDAARRAVDFAVVRTGLGREEAYMLLRVGTPPRPVMATRQIGPE